MQEYRNDQMEILIKEDNDKIILTWLGHSRSLNADIELNPYLKSLAGEITAKHILIDFTQFNSMNSSTVMPILFFIQNLEEHALDTEIIYDGKSSWQRASFVVMEEIIKSYKYIKINAK